LTCFGISVSIRWHLSSYTQLSRRQERRAAASPARKLGCRSQTFIPAAQTTLPLRPQKNHLCSNVRPKDHESSPNRRGNQPPKSSENANFGSSTNPTKSAQSPSPSPKAATSSSKSAQHHTATPTMSPRRVTSPALNSRKSPLTRGVGRLLRSGLTSRLGSLRLGTG
jgi:hypothetical protein